MSESPCLSGIATTLTTVKNASKLVDKNVLVWAGSKDFTGLNHSELKLANLCKDISGGILHSERAVRRKLYEGLLVGLPKQRD